MMTLADAIAHFDSFKPFEDIPSHGQTDADRKAKRYSYAENIEAGQVLVAHVRALAGDIESLAT